MDAIDYRKGMIMKALLAILAGLWASACQASSTCDLRQPPRAAVVDGVHGQYIFIFPDRISKKFTGCQIVWTESGHKWIVYRFSKGVIERFTVDFPQPAQPGNINVDCHYKGGEALERGNKDCLSEERSKGFPWRRQIPELVPPLEKDPRR